MLSILSSNSQNLLLAASAADIRNDYVAAVYFCMITVRLLNCALERAFCFAGLFAVFTIGGSVLLDTFAVAAYTTFVTDVIIFCCSSIIVYVAFDFFSIYA